MRPYKVTVIVDGKRHTFNAVARCWYAAWSEAVDMFCIASCVIVKPV